MPNKLNAFSLQPPASSLVPACWRTWVEIDRAALRHNIHVAKKRAPHAAVIAVLKANAYGHGMEEVAKTLAPHVAYFAVASCEEALRLQRAVTTIPIMLLSAALPCEYPTIAAHGFIPTISSYEEAKDFAAVAPAGAPIHVKIETSMGRLGIAAVSAAQIVSKIAKLPLIIQSFSTHLPSADSDIKSTRTQLASFEKLLPLLKKAAPQAAVHALNSAGLFRFSQHSYQLVRMGLMLYGASPIPSFQKLLQPSLTWKARVSLIQKFSKGQSISYGKTYVAPCDIIVAILSLGYADGYPRQLSNQGAYVLINGRRCSLLGRVTMDQIIVDISRAGKISVGDEVVLLGKQKDQEISASWLASKAGTIPWHLFTGIGERVHRCYS